MWTYHFILMLYFIHVTICEDTVINKRQKRYLLFTKDTQWGVFVTVSIPLHPETTVSVAWFIEANYYNVDNSTYFEPLLGDIETFNKRAYRNVEKIKSFSRHHFYTFIESMLEKYSYRGRPCLLRAICESSSSHFFQDGVQGDLVHFILTPSTSMSEDELEDCYYEAEFWGLEHSCGDYARDCPTSPIDLFSVLIDKPIKGK